MEVGTAADAEFCAEQMLTAPAVAAIMIAALSCFVNFILVVFLVLLVIPRPRGDESSPADVQEGIRAG